jgi:type II secretory pathway pseudopilin PulG
MGYASLISVVAALVIGGIALKTVSPSIVDSIKVAKVDAEIISREKAVYEAILRYMALKGTNPTSMTDLINEGCFLLFRMQTGLGGAIRL